MTQSKSSSLIIAQTLPLLFPLVLLLEHCTDSQSIVLVPDLAFVSAATILEDLSFTISFAWERKRASGHLN